MFSFKNLKRVKPLFDKYFPYVFGINLGLTFLTITPIEVEWFVLTQFVEILREVCLPFALFLVITRALVDDLTDSTVIASQPVKNGVHSIFNPFSSKEFHTLFIFLSNVILDKRNVWWYKVLQIFFFLSILLPYRVVFCNVFSFYFTYSTPLFLFFLFRAYGFSEDLELTLYGYCFINYILFTSVLWCLKYLIERYPFIKKEIIALSYNKKYLYYFAGNPFGKIPKNFQAALGALAFSWAGLTIEDSNLRPVRQHYYEKIIQTYRPNSIE